MSREIKFRAWDKKRKRYAKVIQTTNQGWKGYRDKTYITDGIMRFSKWVLSRFIIEQSTGLKDKNGKEIYEGDRIKIEGSYTVYTVEYGRGVWVARFGDESGDNICLFHYVQKDTVLYAEVIGNIHEPPKDFRPEHLKRMGVSISKGDEE